MSTSLDASTLTPGRTAPDVSLTTPAIALCAWATAGSTSSAVKITSGIVFSFSSSVPPQRSANEQLGGHGRRDGAEKITENLCWTLPPLLVPVNRSCLTCLTGTLSCG